MKTLKISQKELEASNDCGGFKAPKKGKHLDTQMFPECEGTETDRDIVKKTVEKRKKDKKAESTLRVITANGKQTVKLSQNDWINIGIKAGWMKEDNIVEAKKKKKWKQNPWAICTNSVGREDKEKLERCIMDVKKNQKKD